MESAYLSGFPNWWRRTDDPAHWIDFAGWSPVMTGGYQGTGRSLYRYDIVEHGDGTYHWEMREAAPDGRIYEWVPTEKP